jgi:peptidoglycan/LPS O-acetylase OafA/YrhL
MNVMPMQIVAAAAPRRAVAAYRGDIDGLRAVAVTAVVLFHAGITGLSGGFAGVDIFFVISGYLIGGIVHREIGAGRFRFDGFYARRARRILPALIAVSLATLVLGLALLGPAELTRFAVSAAAALLGLSNLWFVHSTDYFAPDARLEPFLMTWSLGIEEQFYLLLPPLLLVIGWLRAKAVLWVVLAISAISLALALVATPLRPVEAFYLLPTRAWELGIGVALAMAHEAGLAVPRKAQPWVALAGVAAIVLALTMLDEQARFPGYAALLPTLGTVALLATHDSGINRRVLASRPLVAVGLISYSWYLWHWPLLALLRICAAGPVPPALLIAVGVGSIVPAWLCWRWIERPFRHPRRPKTDRATLLRYGAALAACVGLLLAIAASHGLPGRVGGAGQRVTAVLADSRGSPCLTDYGTRWPNLSPACLPPDTGPLVALLGDSHASALGDALREAARAHGYGLLQMTAASCPPLLGATPRLKAHPGAAQACAAFDAAAIARAADDPRVKIVVLTAFWESPFSKHALTNGDGLVDVDPRLGGRASAVELDMALTRTLIRLLQAGKRVVLLGDAPWIKFDPALHAWAAFLPLRGAVERAVTPGLDDSAGRVPLRLVEPLDDTGSRLVAAVGAKVPRVRSIALRSVLCEHGHCRTSQGTTPFFIDQQHLSRAGADFVVERIEPRLWGTRD